MSKAQSARLLIAVVGVVVVGLLLRAVDGIAAALGLIFAGFVAISLLAEWAFRSLATHDEKRRDLEDRVRDAE